MLAQKNRSVSRNSGFTLIELMVVIVIIGILAAIGIANFVSAKQRAVDASMKSDLTGAMVALENYKIQNGELPPDLASFQAATGYQLSPGVIWDPFERQPKNGMLSVHMHLAHPQSPNKWHVHYPAQGNKIDIR